MKYPRKNYEDKPTHELYVTRSLIKPSYMTVLSSQNYKHFYVFEPPPPLLHTQYMIEGQKLKGHGIFLVPISVVAMDL